MRTGLVGIALLAACDGASEPGNTDPTADVSDPSDPNGPNDPNDPNTGKATTVELNSLEWELHPDFGTLVYVHWDQSVDGLAVVEYNLDDEWVAAPGLKASEGPNQQLIAGLPYDTAVDWRVTVAGEAQDAKSAIQTAKAPANLPVATLLASDPDGWYEGGNYLLTVACEDNFGWGCKPNWTVLVDRQGRVVWARRSPRQTWVLYPQISVTGEHILIDEFDGPAADSVVRTYLDEEIERIDTPGHHHAMIELPDGTLAWGSNAHGGGEALVEKAPGQKDETIVWTCQDDWPGVGGCRSNSLYYNEADDSYVYSFYTNESVVAIDRASGSSLWWAGKVANGYTFVPSDSQFWWQHGVNWTPQGTLLLSTHDADGGASTNFGREYEVDHKAGTLTRVWEYDAEVYASTNGDIWRLPNGNTLHSLGSASDIKEVDAKGETVWHISFNTNGSRMVGRVQWVEDLYTLMSPVDAGNR